MSGFRILAICSGNVCRSPFVELLLTKLLAVQPGFIVASAGTIARPGQRMTAEMAAAAARYGVSTESSSQHVATRLDEGFVRSAGLILGVSREYRAAAVELDPRAIHRAFTLKEFARLSAAAGAQEPGLTAQALVAELASRRGVAIGDRSLPDDDIDDPIGRPQPVYDRVAEEIATAVETVGAALASARPAATAAPDLGPSSGAPDLSFAFRPR